MPERMIAEPTYLGGGLDLQIYLMEQYHTYQLFSSPEQMTA